MTGQRPEADADAQPTTGLEDLESTAKLPVLDAATIESLEDTTGREPTRLIPDLVENLQLQSAHRTSRRVHRGLPMGPR